MKQKVPDLDIRYLPTNMAWCLCWRDGAVVTVKGRTLYNSKYDLLHALGFNSWCEWESFRNRNLSKVEP